MSETEKITIRLPKYQKIIMDYFLLADETSSISEFMRTAIRNELYERLNIPK